MHAQCHEGLIPLDVIGPIMVEHAKKAKVPVCVMLDHGEDLDYLKKSLDMGFTSVMYDGSTTPYEDNVRTTCEAVKLATSYGADVEAKSEAWEDVNSVQVHLTKQMMPRFIRILIWLKILLLRQESPL